MRKSTIEVKKEAELMLYKNDWNQCREWLTGWWRREVHDHWALAVFAPRAKPLPALPAPPAPTNHRECWLDAAGNLARAEAQMAQTFYGGCAFPYVTASLGPGSLNTFLGSEVEFMPETVWYQPFITDPAQANLALDSKNFYWQWTIETTRMYQQAMNGKCLTAIPDLIEGIDILSEVLGTQELLVYLLDCPQEIHRLLRQLDDLYFQAFEPLYEMVKDECNGNSFIAFNAWGPGRTIKSQCDFSAMISAGMFAEFVVPYLERQCRRVDYSVYHLDGPGAIQHLPHLLKVKSLNAIQWTSGAGMPDAGDRMWWDKIWKPVYAAGKAAMVHGVPPEKIEPFLKEFGQKGTFISTSTKTEAEARKLIDDSAKWDA